MSDLARKFCPKCKTEANFHRHKSMKDGLQSWCVDCSKKAITPKIRQNRARTHAAMPIQKREERARRSRAAYLLRTYRLSVAEYDNILASQGGGCAVCGTKVPGGRWNAFHVDHDHETGVVRGILCDLHNRAAGLVQDDPEIAANLAAYLRRPR
jgi:hypothetical protein